jgi:hypothetical protein
LHIAVNDRRPSKCFPVITARTTIISVAALLDSSSTHLCSQTQAEPN